MNETRFIRNNLRYFWQKNLLLALGIAISGAVLTGALIVGDSVKYSLGQIVEKRLGEVSHVLTAGDRYFTDQYARRVADKLNIPVSSILLQEGIGVVGGGQIRVNQIQVLGVDALFDELAGQRNYFNRLSGDTVIISQNLANRLGLEKGDEFLLRIQKASLIPLNAPFVSDAESVVPVRVTIGAIASDSQMGRFNLKVSQTAPFNVFMSRKELETHMDFEGMVNVMLLRSGGRETEEQILEAVQDQFGVLDAGLKLELLEKLNQIEVTSSRVFIDDVLSDPLQNAHADSRALLTYFVNKMESSSGSTPYSFISTIPASWLRQDEMIINQWLADDLSVNVGDSIRISYFIVGPLRELTDTTVTFTIKAIVPVEGAIGDEHMMPDIPGLSDAGNCRDWETGVPIELESIRDKDEDYWTRYRGIPKSYISIDRAKTLWKNRFGTYTAFRYDGMDFDVESLEASLKNDISPISLGFQLEATRSKGLDAAGNGVDFTELFGGLSFFLLVAGVLLSILLFLLNLESRKEQLRTLVVMGIPLGKIRKIMLAEGMLVALLGSGAGVLLAILYNRLVFSALNGVWKDVVRTEMMQIDIRLTTLMIGLLLSLLIAFFALVLPLNRVLKRQFKAHVSAGAKKQGIRSMKLPALAFILPGIAALGLILSQLIRMELVNVPVFFAAGGLLLLSANLFFLWYLGSLQQSSKKSLDLQVLSWKNALRNRTRSISIVILFAIGAFLVISTGSNRKDLFVNAADPGSGTGGFLYYAESTVPALQNLNDPRVRYDFGLDGAYSFVQLRKASGDDASCLNLNKIINPQVLGIDPAMLEGRYTFVTSTPLLDEQNPWLSLEQELPGGLIPAIADETVIKWGLGLKVGDTLRYVNSNGGSMELLLVGGLAPSIFQGNVLISSNNFLEQFPESSGTHVFLVEGESADTTVIRSEVERGLRDLGWDMQLSAARLSEFNSVTNTYLSIFMVMGALGLLVGTFGLVVVLSRSILERKQEIALLRAMGYGPGKIRQLVVREYMILLLVGIGTGFVAAIVATLPSILSSHSGSSLQSILLWLGILVLNGWVWILLISQASLKNKVLNTALRND